MTVMPSHSGAKNQGRKKLLFELLPGYSCNANCRFCSIDPAKRKMNMSTNEILHCVYRAKLEGFKYLGIGGGEPTVRNDLVPIIRYAKKLDFDAIRIETNGIVLSYPDYCRTLVDSGLDFVKISIHGHQHKIHDYLTQVPGSFRMVLKAIGNLQKLNVRIEINTVLNKINYRYAPQFVRFFSQLGIGSFCFIYPLYTGKMAQNWRNVGVRMKTVLPGLKDSLQLFDLLELDKALVFNIPRCVLGQYGKRAIEEYHMKLFAPDYVVEDSDTDVFGGRKALRRCGSCPYADRCGGIRTDYLSLFGEKEFLR